MLAIFKNGVVSPPRELHSPAPTRGPGTPTPEDTLKNFLAAHPSNAFSLGFPNKAFLAYSTTHQRMFCGVNDVYCIFNGHLNNLCGLNRQYGLSTKSANEAMFVIEAYCTLRDRGPFPAHQVLKELEGSFGFVLYDNKSGAVFAAAGADRAVSLYWGIGSDGSTLISDDLDLIKSSCGKSFAPFPAGCMYHSEGGLMSFEHPMKKMKAMPRVDSEGAMCGAIFAVDAYSKVNTMPRVGSEANWAPWG